MKNITLPTITPELLMLIYFSEQRNVYDLYKEYNDVFLPHDMIVRNWYLNKHKKLDQFNRITLTNDGKNHLDQMFNINKIGRGSANIDLIYFKVKEYMESKYKNIPDKYYRLFYASVAALVLGFSFKELRREIRAHSKETKKKMSKPRPSYPKGKKFSPEHRARIKAFQSSRPEKINKKISNTRMGHEVSEETRRKISIGNTGKRRIFTEEHKANLKQAQQKRFAKMKRKKK